MVIQSDVSLERLLGLGREYDAARRELEGNSSVKRRLRGCKVDLPKKVGFLLEQYRGAAGKLKELGIDVDTGLVEKLKDCSSLRKAACDKYDYLTLRDISCVSADGNVFEKYDSLYVDKDIVRDADGSQVYFTPYNSAAHFVKQGGFSPSVALSCNILVRSYENKGNPDFNKLLMQYKDKGNGTGWHAQNTLIDWGSRKIIHYPNDKDFPVHGGSDNINQSKRLERGFNPKKFKDLPLEKALQIPEFEKFIRNLTGLKQPETLIEIGKYFSKPARVWVSGSSEVCAAWLGCNVNYFDINSYNNLGNNIAARGVSCEPA